MPISIEMEEFTHSGVKVAGGWTAKVPAMQIEPRDAEAYVGWITGKRRAEAEAQFHGACQRMWTAAWLKALKERMAVLARQYREVNPDLGGAGFDPAALQGAYVPGSQHGHSRSITPLVRKLLVEMGARHRASLELEEEEDGNLGRR